MITIFIIELRESMITTTGFFYEGSNIGNYSDDYVGCDSSRNMMFAYNGDANDESMGGSTGYGTETSKIEFFSLAHALCAL